MINLVLLPKGSIRDLFAPWRSASIRKGIERTNPLSLTEVPDQCVHMILIQDPVSGAIYYERCVEQARNAPPHGWLCPKHSEKPTVALGIDDGYTDYVLQVEADALKAIKRETYGGKFKIQFVEGLRMKNPPQDFDDNHKGARE